MIERMQITRTANARELELEKELLAVADLVQLASIAIHSSIATSHPNVADVLRSMPGRIRAMVRGDDD